MKKTSHNIYESPERQHYKKKYLERVLEEEDAARQIKDYRHEQEMSDSQPVVAEGRLRNLPFRTR